MSLEQVRRVAEVLNFHHPYWEYQLSNKSFPGVRARGIIFGKHPDYTLWAYSHTPNVVNLWLTSDGSTTEEVLVRFKVKEDSFDVFEGVQWKALKRGPETARLRSALKRHEGNALSKLLVASGKASEKQKSIVDRIRRLFGGG